MNDLLTIVEEQKQLFGAHPFFAQLAAAPLEMSHSARASFFASMSYFVMSFSDLNKYVLPFEQPQDLLQTAINRHCKEDAQHWKWFVHDLKKLNLDQAITLVDCLRFLWSDQLSPSRRLIYDLISMSAGKDALQRLAVIEATEAAGNVAFQAFVGFTAGAGVNLQYFGPLHLEHETGHAMGSGGALLEQLSLTANQYAQAESAIILTFRGFHRFMDQLLARAAAEQVQT